MKVELPSSCFTCGSRESQRMMLPIIYRLEAQRAFVWVYLNDFLLIAPSADICRMDPRYTLQGPS